MKNITWNDLHEGDSIQLLSMEDADKINGAGGFSWIGAAIAVISLFTGGTPAIIGGSLGGKWNWLF